MWKQCKIQPCTWAACICVHIFCRAELEINRCKHSFKPFAQSKESKNIAFQYITSQYIAFQYIKLQYCYFARTKHSFKEHNKWMFFTLSEKQNCMIHNNASTHAKHLAMPFIKSSEHIKINQPDTTTNKNSTSYSLPVSVPPKNIMLHYNKTDYNVHICTINKTGKKSKLKNQHRCSW